MLFTGPIAGPPDRTRAVSPGHHHPIVEWQASYLTGNGGQVIRDIAIQKGFLPPLEVTWDGRRYTRQFMNEDRLSVTYVCYSEDQR